MKHEPRRGYLVRRYLTQALFWRGRGVTGAPWTGRHTEAIVFQSKEEAKDVIKRRALVGATVVHAGDPLGTKVSLT